MAPEVASMGGEIVQLEMSATLSETTIELVASSYVRREGGIKEGVILGRRRVLSLSLS
jgi:hypothetical protein